MKVLIFFHIYKININVKIFKINKFNFVSMNIINFKIFKNKVNITQ